MYLSLLFDQSACIGDARPHIRRAARKMGGIEIGEVRAEEEVKKEFLDNSHNYLETCATVLHPSSYAYLWRKMTKG
jgi:hypothetical protein